jgi:Zn-dependent peptidase ImmA (M78 family)
LGFGPIEHMTRLAENVGAVVTSFQAVSKEVDALSVALKRPIIVRNEAKPSTCRQRFDVGHELGHFVLHQGRVTGDRVTEMEAHRFAGALLVPRSMMLKLFPRPKWSRLDWTGLRDFKLTWKVSKAALLYRARQLELINDDQYRTGFITLKRTGEAITEREDALVPAEAPELVKRAFFVLAAKKHLQPVQIAAALHVRLPLLQDLVGFPLIAPAAEARRRPALSIVR